MQDKDYPEIFVSILEDARASGASRISLVDAIAQYDGRNKLAPLLSELNSALSSLNWIATSKEKKELFFTFSDTPVGPVQVADTDFSWADKEYRKRFWKSLKELNSKQNNET